MAGSLPFVDIHCHMLPGLDDGAVNLGVSLAMAQMAVADGIETIVVTPHQLGNYSRNQGTTIRAYTERLQRELKQRSIPLKVLPGADVRIEPDMTRRIQTGDVVSLADRQRHVLLELPHELYMPPRWACSDHCGQPEWSASSPIPNETRASCETRTSFPAW